MSHEEVRTRLEASIKNMKTITDKFLSAIIVSVEKIPYVAPNIAFFFFSAHLWLVSQHLCVLFQIRDAVHLQSAEGHSA